jgi:riboflavin kinase
LPNLTFAGTVFSGEGKGKCFLMLPWVQRQVMEKLGFLAYAGTLNIRLDADNMEKRKQLDPKQGLLVKPESGFYRGVLFKATIQNVEAAIVLPLMPDYPIDVLEVVAPVYLRGKLGFKDSDKVALSVTF